MRHWSSGLFGMVLVSGAWCAGPVAVHAATWLPVLELEGRHDDNVLHRAEGSEGFVTVVTPGLTVFNRDPITSYELSGRAGFTSYSRIPSAKTSRADMASFILDHRPSVFNQLEARARYVRSVDPIDFQDGVVTTRGDVTNVFARGNADFLRVGGGTRYRRWDYAAGELADGAAIDMAGRIHPIHTDITRGTFEIRQRSLEIADVTTLRADYQTVSLRREHSAMFSTEFTAGRVQVDYGAAGGVEVGPALAFGLTRAGGDPEAPVTLRLRVADDIATTVEASFDIDRDGRSVTLAWDTAVEADGGQYRVATLTRRGSATVRDTLYGGQVIELGGSFGRIRPLRGSGPEVDLWRAGAGISTPLGPWVTGRVGWDFARQDAPEAGSPTAFDRNRFTLAFTAKPRVE